MNPMIMSSDAVRLVSDGLKTQRRFYLMPQPTAVEGGWRWTPPTHRKDDKVYRCSEGRRLTVPQKVMRFQIGMRFSIVENFYQIDEDTVVYRSDGRDNHGRPWRDFLPGCGFIGWTKATSMPAEYSRHHIEVTRSWHEQVQSISVSDARAEGAGPKVSGDEAISWFAEQWDHRRKQGKMFSDNPWCIGFEFKVIGP